jgi:hypothetical protein
MMVEFIPESFFVRIEELKGKRGTFWEDKTLDIKGMWLMESSNIIQRGSISEF